MSGEKDGGMTSSRPYLIRALGEWIVDNQMTPYIIVDANHGHAIVPRQFIENGKIVLNIGPYAVRNLEVSNDQVTFSARFSGVSMNVEVPVLGVLAIYARENGQGMVFAEDGNGPVSPPPEGGGKPEATPAKPALKLVK